MKNLRNIVVAVILAGIAVGGYAQEMTFGELQSKGAVAIVKDDLAALLKGATLNFTSFVTGRPVQVKFYDDGTLIVAITDRAGGRLSQNATGKWSIVDNGYCSNIVFRGHEDKYCNKIWKLGEKYHITSDQDGYNSARELSVSK